MKHYEYTSVPSSVKQVVCDKCGKAININSNGYYEGYFNISITLDTICSIGGRMIIPHDFDMCWECGDKILKDIEQTISREALK
jgi:rRNA maturation endonuclease Nob1